MATPPPNPTSRFSPRKDGLPHVTVVADSEDEASEVDEMLVDKQPADTGQAAPEHAGKKKRQASASLDHSDHEGTVKKAKTGHTRPPLPGNFLASAMEDGPALSTPVDGNQASTLVNHSQASTLIGGTQGLTLQTSAGESSQTGSSGPAMSGSLIGGSPIGGPSRQVSDATAPEANSPTSDNSPTSMLPAVDIIEQMAKVVARSEFLSLNASRAAAAGQHPVAPPTPPATAAAAAAAAEEPFNFWNRLVERHDLLYQLIPHLDFASLLALFSISKQVFACVSLRQATVLTDFAARNAPESLELFHFRGYRDLCVIDPARRRHPARPEQVRLVPSLRWLRFVLFREDTVRTIVRALGRAGHRLPVGAERVIKQLWQLMDLPDSARRTGVVRNAALWPARDLAVACLFLCKLDLRLADPLDPNVKLWVREMLMGQRSMSAIADALTGRGLRTHADLLRMFAEWRVAPSQRYPAAPVFGVPARHVGRLSCEYWAPGHPIVRRPDEILLLELRRRRLPVQRYIGDMVLFGNYHRRTGADIPGELHPRPEPPPVDRAEEFLQALEQRVRDLDLRKARKRESRRLRPRTGGDDDDDLAGDSDSGVELD